MLFGKPGRLSKNTSEVPFLGGGNVIGTLISLVGQLGDAGLVGLLAAALIWRLLDDDIKSDLKK